MFNIIKKIRAWNIKRKQADVKREYERYGFTDSVLEKQVALNKKRRKYDIPDESKIVYENFVQ
jgi:hypothetical protein